MSLIGMMVSAQTDTIQVSTNTAVVIFPTNVSDRFLGDDLNFFMSDPSENGSAFSKRILKLYYNERSVVKKDFTNLTVITVNGNSYEFTLEYIKAPERKTWYIKPEQAVTNILGKKVQSNYQAQEITGPEQDDTIAAEPRKEDKEHTAPVGSDEDDTTVETTDPTRELYESDKMEYFRLRSYYMQFDKAKIPRFFARSGDVFLWLKGIYYNENEIYMQFKVENREGVDFDTNFLKFSIATSYKKSSSNQKTEIVPVFRYKVPKRVYAGTENHFVVVFDKFSLDRNKVVVVDLDEENGNRNVSLEIDHHLANNPFKIK